MTFGILTFLYILLNRYDFLAGPQKYFVLKILNIQNPLLFQKDILTSLSNQTYYTFLAWPFAWLASWIDLRWTFFIGHILTTFFYLYGVYRLGKTIFKDPQLAFLGVLGVFFIKPVLIDSSLYPTVFYHRNVSWVLQIFAILYFLNRRPVITGILLGLAFDVTPYAASHLALLFAFSIFFERKEFHFREIMQGGTVFLLTAAPMLLWRLLKSGDITLLIPPSVWLSLLKFTAAIYCFPSTLWQSQYGQRSTFLMALVWPFLYSAGFIRRFLSFDGIHKKIGLLMGGVVFLFALGTIFSELFPLAVVLQLQFFRAHRFFVLFSILYFVFYLLHRFREEARFIPRFFISVTLAAFLASKMILCTVLAAIDFLLSQSLLKRIRPTLQITILFLLGCAAVIPSLKQPLLLNRLFHLNLFFPVACVLTLLFLKNFVRLPVYAFFFVLTLLPPYWGIEKQFFKNPILALTDQIEWPWTSRVSQPYESFFKWAESNTKQDALFLTPPVPVFVRYFSILAKRGEILSIEGSVAATSFSYGKEWSKRMGDFGGFPIESFQERYDQLSTEKLTTLLKTYPFDYVVTLTRGKSLDWPIAFQNDEIIAYRVPG